MEKKTSLSQIPGLQYRQQTLANVPRPVTWDESRLSEATKLSVDQKVVGHAVYESDVPHPPDQILDAIHSKFLELFKYCEVNDVVSVAGLEGARPQVQQLLNDHQLRPEIMKYLCNRKKFNSETHVDGVRVWAD